MAVITNPIVLNSTVEDTNAILSKTNAILSVIASKSGGLTPSSLSDIQKIVQSGLAPQVFSIGDQILVPWKDVADNNKEYSLVFDVVAFTQAKDFEGVLHPSMILQSHYLLPFGIQFSNYQAFYIAEAELPAGTYNLTIGNSWGANCVTNKVYQFTLTTAVPIGGQLSGLRTAPDTSPLNWKVYSYTSSSSATPVETVDLAEGNAGTSLGTLSFTPTEPLNSLQCVAYGYNDWSKSAYRQFLNSKSGINSWWTPQHKFDRPPNELSTKAGFLSGFEDDFLQILKPSFIKTYKNTLTDDGTVTETLDTFFLPSLEEQYIVPQLAGEGNAWDYWQTRLQRTTPREWYKETPELVKYSIANKTSAQYYRLRSAYRGYGYHAWDVNPSGSVNYYGNSATSLTGAPAFNIY